MDNPAPDPVNNDQNSTQDPNVVHPGNTGAPDGGTRKARLRFPAINKEVDGVMTHPFLVEDSDVDRILIRQLLSEPPFLQKQGAVTETWNKLKKELVEFAPLHFPPDCAIRTLQKRMNEYLDFAKKAENAAQLRTGTDDEEAPSEIQQGVESLYELYKGRELAREEASARALAQQQETAERSATLETASMMGRAPSSVIRRPSTDGAGSASSKSAGNRSRSYSPICDSVTDAMAQFNQRQAGKDERKRRKLELKQIELNLEQERLKMEQQRAEAELAERRARADVEMAERRTMMEAMVELMKQMKDK